MSRAPPTRQVDIDGVVSRLGALFSEGKQDAALGEVRALLTLLLNDNQRLTLDLARVLRRHLQQTSEKISPA